MDFMCISLTLYKVQTPYQRTHINTYSQSDAPNFQIKIKLVLVKIKINKSRKKTIVFSGRVGSQWEPEHRLETSLPCTHIQTHRHTHTPPS